MAGGYAVASSVSFSIAGKLSDIFGRRYIMLVGNLVSLVGAVSGTVILRDLVNTKGILYFQIVSSVAESTNTIIAGMVLLGFGCGIIWIAYAGISELLPNKWRYVYPFIIPLLS